MLFAFFNLGENAEVLPERFPWDQPYEIMEKMDGWLGVLYRHEGTFKVAAAGSNVTLNVDPTNWFMSSGSRLDPSDPNVDHSKVDANIKASLDAFDDDDHDGRRDD